MKPPEALQQRLAN